MLPCLFAWCCLLLCTTHSGAQVFLEALDEPGKFTRQVTTAPGDVMRRSEIKALLDWYAVSGPDGLQFHMALLLQPEGGQLYSHSSGHSLAVVSHVLTQCPAVFVHSREYGRVTSVAARSSPRTVQFIYVCEGEGSSSLRMLVARWDKGELSVAVDESIFFLGMAKSWHLPRGQSGAVLHLLYVRTENVTPSFVLVETSSGSENAYPAQITRLQLPQKEGTPWLTVTSSCFLPSVGISGLIQRSSVDGHSQLRLYRLFPSRRSLELLMETNSLHFTEPLEMERRHCTQPLRAVFTDCHLDLFVTDAIRVNLTVVASIESPSAMGTQKNGRWTECGEALLQSGILIREGGAHIVVSPLRLAHYNPVQAPLSAVQLSTPAGRVPGRDNHCTFFHNGNINDDDGCWHLTCNDAGLVSQATFKSASRHCTAGQAWWKPSTNPNLYLCDSLGITVTELIIMFLLIFTSALFGQLLTDLYATPAESGELN
ncbi:hypothetical protein ERJ75_001603900 [Trypanosoma vivax]|uniref:Uncharacterized protein n=1 Tax=Trypanosoma vivax (strain Y486) TaxID=1055687 RepID=G0TSQ5_TRYVY|nr:hypothetical protein ERJ75_001603900 [Trypanosoma vivax]CCC46983.1 conserved hypothetical protein [Trypanosoma vivax Y486]